MYSTWQGGGEIDKGDLDVYSSWKGVQKVYGAIGTVGKD